MIGLIVSSYWPVRAENFDSQKSDGIEYVYGTLQCLFKKNVQLKSFLDLTMISRNLNEIISTLFLIISK